MSKPKYLQHDCLDDRRELVVLLRKLPPHDRIAFVEDACRRSKLPNSDTRPTVSRKTRELADEARKGNAQADNALSNEAYFDLWALATQYDLDLTAALVRLERFVKRRGVSS